MRLIDADKLRQDVLDFPNCYNGFSDTYDKARIIDAIDEQPTIKERKKGTWEIDVDCEYDVFDIAGERTWAIKATCSECGFTMSFIEGHGVFNYCPNCGARMTTED